VAWRPIVAVVFAVVVAVVALGRVVSEQDDF